MPKLYDRVEGRFHDLTPERIVERKAMDPGRWSDGPHVPITQDDYAKMTSHERGAAAMVAKMHAEGKTP